MSYIDHFRRKSIKIKYLSIGIMILVVLVFIAYSNKVSKYKYEIRVPDYSHTTSIGYTSYFCNTYTQENGCIKFVDAFGVKQEICGGYQKIER